MEHGRGGLRPFTALLGAPVEEGDLRAKASGEQFDIATLYNNIYYFSVAERDALLERCDRKSGSSQSSRRASIGCTAMARRAGK